MIKFFRTIRQQLITQNKVSKYLLYAIGEIVLVMIGILLALQVNNLNEERKDRVKSHDVLMEIRENIQFNTSQFKAEIREEKIVIKSIDIVLENVNKYRKYDDSLDFHMYKIGYWPASSRKSSGYETLKSQGVELIKSTGLRQSIIDLYEKTYNEISEIILETRADHETSIVPIKTELFFFHPSNPNLTFNEHRATPFNYDEVVNSQKFRGVFSYWRNQRNVAIILRQVAIAKNNELINAINNELEKN